MEYLISSIASAIASSELIEGNKLKKEYKAVEFSIPNKKKKCHKRVTNIDEDVIRRIINNFYIQEESYPTLNKLNEKFISKIINFKGSIQSLITNN